MFGELIPLGGGDPIPLLKKNLLVGRRESCDIVLRFPNVSSHHCQLTLSGGYWYVKDMQSKNGVKVNGQRTGDAEKRLDPGDTLAVAKHQYEIRYSPVDNGAVGPPPPDTVDREILGRSLLDRLGLQKPKFGKDKEEPKHDRHAAFRYDIMDDSAGQLRKSKHRDEPI